MDLALALLPCQFLALHPGPGLALFGNNSLGGKALIMKVKFLGPPSIITGSAGTPSICVNISVLLTIVMSVRAVGFSILSTPSRRYRFGMVSYLLVMLNGRKGF